MAAWDDVIDFDNVGEWPMELSGWLKLLQTTADEEQRSQIVQLVRKCLQEARIEPTTVPGCSRAKSNRSRWGIRSKVNTIPV